MLQAMACGLGFLVGCGGQPVSDGEPADAEVEVARPAEAEPAGAEPSSESGAVERTGLWTGRHGGSSLAPCDGEEVLRVEDGAALDEAVRLARPGVEGPVLVTVRGRLSAPGGGEAAEAVIRVSEVVAVHGASTCPGIRAHRPLEGTAWQLAGLPDPDPAVVAAGAWLRLLEEPPRLEGSTGCGPLAGRYEWEVTRLRFGGLEAGGAGCSAAALHDAFLSALARTGSYRVRGDTLELLGEDGPVATFRAPGG